MKLFEMFDKPTSESVTYNKNMKAILAYFDTLSPIYGDVGRLNKDHDSFNLNFSASTKGQRGEYDIPKAKAKVLADFKAKFGDITTITVDTPDAFAGKITDDSLSEAEGEEPAGVTGQEIADAWMAEFPNSSVHAGKAFGGGTTFKFRLAKDNTEVSSGIMCKR